MGKKEIPINWIGSSYEDLLAFPDDAKQNAGYQLGRLQSGLEPTDCKPLTGLGKGIGGISEIRIWAKDGGYRVAYVLKIGDAITVLHCFEKKTQKTAKKDLNMIVQRFKEAKAAIEKKS